MSKRQSGWAGNFKKSEALQRIAQKLLEDLNYDSPNTMEDELKEFLDIIANDIDPTQMTNFSLLSA